MEAQPTISFDEIVELWPKDPSGDLCSRLLQRYAFTLLVETAIGADCTAERSQAEAAANKTLAKLAKDFGKLTKLPEAKPQRSIAHKPLRRFEKPQPEKPTSSEK